MTSRQGALVASAASGLIVLTAAIAAPPAAAETALERGAYLVRGIAACGNCHTPQGPDGPVPGRELAGGPPLQEEAFVAYAPNITPDPETGIGRWTDAELVVAIREGRRPDGSIIGPPMPFDMYRDLSDTDVNAIVAYLRSVPAVRSESPPSRYDFPLPPSWGPSVGSVADVSREDKVAYGAYLAGPVGHCITCHTPMEKGVSDYGNRLGAGGFPFPGPWGVSVSTNITADPVAGIGAIADAEIRQMITQGVRPDGSPMLPPMPYAWYAKINEPDLDAIVAYLRTLPPIR